MMEGWIDGGQIRIALESSSGGGVSSKDVMSISVSHLIWEEEIMRSKMDKYQNQNGILNKKLQFIHISSMEHTSIGKNRRVMPGAEEVAAGRKRPQKPMTDGWPCKNDGYVRGWLEQVPSSNCMTDSLYTAVVNKYYDFSI
jgi:hypothetical protein